MDKAHFRNIILLLIVGLLMLLIVNPIGNFPLGDDYVYARPVSTLIHSGTYKLTDPCASVVVGQVIWGILFCLPFGFSFTTLRLSVIILGFAGLIVFYLLMNIFTGNKRLSLISALLLLANPIFFSLSNSFMTDIPFLSFVLFAIYFFTKALDTPKLKYLLPAIIFSVLATLVRQLGIIVPVAYAFTWVVKTKRPLIRSAKYFLPLIIAAVFLEFTMVWLKHINSATLYNGDKIISLLGSPNQLAFNIFKRSSFIFYCCGISLFPVLLFSGYNSFKSLSRGQKVKAGMFMAFFIPSLMYGWGKFPIVEIGNIVDGDSIGPKTLRDAYILHLHDPGKLSSGMRYFLAFVGLIGAIFLLLNLSIFLIRLMEHKEKDNPASSLKKMQKPNMPLLPKEKDTFKILNSQCLYVLFFAAGYAFLICLPSTFFDRYCLPLFPAILLLTGLLTQKSWPIKRFMFPALAYIALLAIFSSLATHDYIQWNRTRWEAADYVTKDFNVPPYRVDGGMEYDGWIFGSLFQKDKEKEEKFWYVAYDEWMIAFGEVPGYNVIKEYPYTNYLPHEQRELYILKRDPKGNTTDSTPQQRFEAKIQDLEKNLEKNPTAQGYFELGNDYLQEGRINDCITANKKVVDINPDYLIAYNNMSVAYIKLFMWKEAIEEAKKALSMDSSFTSAKLNLNYAVAMSKSNNVKIPPTGYLYQSVEYYNEGKYQDCISACRKCLELDSTSYVAWNNMGSSYIALGQYSEAENACEHALKIKPDFDMALSNLQIAKQNLGKQKI